MNRFRGLGAVIALAGCLSVGPSKIGLGEIPGDAISIAISRYLCFAAHWEGLQFPRGKTVEMTVRNQGDWAYAWIDRTSVHGPSVLDSFFAVYDLRGAPLVAWSDGYNPDYPSEYSKAARAKVFGEGAESRSLTLPTDCTPKAADKSPSEREMLGHVERSVHDQLRDFNRTLGPIYPSVVQIIIADFRWYYPRTYVYIPATAQVLWLGLFNAESPTDDKYVKLGYPMSFARPSETLIEKIRRQGTIREIRLDD